METHATAPTAVGKRSRDHEDQDPSSETTDNNHTSASSSSHSSASEGNDDKAAKATRTETKSTPQKATRRPIRVWADGCFDMMHFGHANALRQARALGDILVVGVHSDAEITKNKGPPVMNEEERYTAVEACKWADEVVRDAPYVTRLEDLNKYNIDFCVHGDDITTSADGSDCYAEVKNAGRYKEVPRTQGVSTTDLVRRMLECSKDHHMNELDTNNPLIRSMSEHTSQVTGMSKFCTSGKLRLFSDGKEPSPTDKVVYVDGAFDLFHVGHIKLLEKARALGDFLLVGVCDDHVVNRYK